MRKRTKAVIAVTAILLVFGAWIAFAQEEPEGKVPEVRVKAAEIVQVKETDKPKDGEEIAESSKTAENVKVKTKAIEPSKAQTDPKKPEKAEVKPDAPKQNHTHSWEAVYKDIIVYDTVNVYGDRCNNCGFSTAAAGSMYAHIDADPFDGCGSYSTGVVVGEKQISRTESQVAGYICLCGKSK